MHYTIEYDDVTSCDTKQKALDDCRKWLGRRQFNKVVQLLKEDQQQSSRYMVTVGLSFQGIEGYPAEVLIDTYWK